MPSFIMGSLMLVVLSVQLGWFPAPEVKKQASAPKEGIASLIDTASVKEDDKPEEKAEDESSDAE